MQRRYKNRGAALAGLGRFDDAVADFDRAIALQPDYAEAHADRAAALANLGRREEALASCDRAIALKPDSPEARFNKGACHLALGDYRTRLGGVRMALANQARCRATRIFPAPFGEANRQSPTRRSWFTPNRDLAIRCNFAAMCRCWPRLPTSCWTCRVRWCGCCRAWIAPFGLSRAAIDLPPFDAWIPMLSLPLRIPHHARDHSGRGAIFACRSGTIVRAGATASLRLPGRKVGLVWAGSPFSPQPRALAMDRRRSMTLQQFAPLADDSRALPDFVAER